MKRQHPDDQKLQASLKVPRRQLDESGGSASVSHKSNDSSSHGSTIRTNPSTSEARTNAGESTQPRSLGTASIPNLPYSNASALGGTVSEQALYRSLLNQQGNANALSLLSMGNPLMIQQQPVNAVLMATVAAASRRQLLQDSNNAFLQSMASSSSAASRFPFGNLSSMSELARMQSARASNAAGNPLLPVSSSTIMSLASLGQQPIASMFPMAAVPASFLHSLPTLSQGSAASLHPFWSSLSPASCQQQLMSAQQQHQRNQNNVHTSNAISAAIALRMSNNNNNLATTPANSFVPNRSTILRPLQQSLSLQHPLFSQQTSSQGSIATAAHAMPAKQHAVGDRQESASMRTQELDHSLAITIQSQFPDPTKPGIYQHPYFADQVTTVSFDVDNIGVEYDNIDDQITDLPRALSLLGDYKRLSPHQVLLRLQIEVFRANEEDLHIRTRGRNKPIRRGQIGLRCRHCAHLPMAERQRGSTYFPASILGVYQAAQNMSTTHIQCGLCHSMPNEIKQEFTRLISGKRASSGAGRQYWSQTAARLGLVDAEEGIRFENDLTDEDRKKLAAAGPSKKNHYQQK